MMKLSSPVEWPAEVKVQDFEATAELNSPMSTPGVKVVISPYAVALATDDLDGADHLDVVLLDPADVGQYLHRHRAKRVVIGQELELDDLGVHAEQAGDLVGDEGARRGQVAGDGAELRREGGGGGRPHGRLDDRVVTQVDELLPAAAPRQQG
jgi:hypothetical protein